MRAKLYAVRSALQAKRFKTDGVYITKRPGRINQVAVERPDTNICSVWCQAYICSYEQNDYKESTLRQALDGRGSASSEGSRGTSNPRSTHCTQTRPHRGRSPHRGSEAARDARSAGQVIEGGFATQVASDRETTVWRDQDSGDAARRESVNGFATSSAVSERDAVLASRIFVVRRDHRKCRANGVIDEPFYFDLRLVKRTEDPA